MLEYSPLCDVSFPAYLAYLFASVGDGANLERLVSVCWRQGGRELDGCSTGAGVNFFAVDGGSVSSASVDEVAGLCDDSRQDSVYGANYSGVGDAGGRAACAKGCAGGAVGGSSGVTNSVGGNGVFQRPSEKVLDEELRGTRGVVVSDSGDVSSASERGGSERPLEKVPDGELRGPRGGLSVGRGPKYERNQRMREAKVAAEVRRNGGFYSQVSVEEREALVSQRLSRYRLENKLAIAQAEMKLGRLEADLSSGFSEKCDRLRKDRVERSIKSLERFSSPDSSSSGFSDSGGAKAVNAECVRLKKELVRVGGLLDKAKKDVVASKNEVEAVKKAFDREIIALRRDFDPKNYG